MEKPESVIKAEEQLGIDMIEALTKYELALLDNPNFVKANMPDAVFTFATRYAQFKLPNEFFGVTEEEEVTLTVTLSRIPRWMLETTEEDENQS